MAEEGNNTIFKMIGLALVVIIIAAGTSYLVMNYQKNSDVVDATDEGENKDIGPTYELGDFVVNLSEMGGYKYIKASIVVEINQSDLRQELNKRNPQVRDMVISILRNQKLKDLQAPGAEVIKNQISNKLNQIVTKGEIENVWFTQLVIQ